MIVLTTGASALARLMQRAGPAAVQPSTWTNAGFPAASGRSVRLELSGRSDVRGDR